MNVYCCSMNRGLWRGRFLFNRACASYGYPELSSLWLRHFVVVLCAVYRGLARGNVGEVIDCAVFVNQVS